MVVVPLVTVVESIVVLCLCIATADGGTEAVSGGRGDDNTCCLSNDVILRLALLGIKVLIVYSSFIFGLLCSFFACSGVSYNSGSGFMVPVMPVKGLLHVINVTSSMPGDVNTSDHQNLIKSQHCNF